jgi:hypothetical protein
MELKSAMTGQRLEELVDDTPSTDVHFHTMDATTLFCDNLGAVQSSSNPASSKRSKHIDIRYWKIREYQEQQRIVVKHVDGKENPADAFTKPLPADKFKYYMRMIGLQKANNDALMCLTEHITDRLLAIDSTLNKLLTAVQSTPAVPSGSPSSGSANNANLLARQLGGASHETPARKQPPTGATPTTGWRKLRPGGK